MITKAEIHIDTSSFTGNGLRPAVEKILKKTFPLNCRFVNRNWFGHGFVVRPFSG
jgi:hypothetical protein